ncbi:hypothetical protein G7046_g7088 [Stylonectria norvegica]|nr:hypothetical protein G7046_g7088 [Stylonectria norvegica]
MADSSSKYACDACRSRKVKCSRERSGCRRCRIESIACSYSRSGVIRRHKRQKHPAVPTGLPTPNYETPINSERVNLRRPPQLALDSTGIALSTYERLRRLVGKDHDSLKALASLLEEYAAAWQGSAAFDKLSEGAASDFFTFEEDEIISWVDAFVATLQNENILLTSAPPEVLTHLLASRPHQIRDRAWLVMFYCIALNVVSSSKPLQESTKAKLMSNLWLAFNDVRLLLEPSATSIQALVILACYAEEFMTPSICWSLVTKACTMLQALGVTHWRLDSQTRERRIMLFWRLNIMDKTMALILCRPPTFHREMTTEIAMPALDKLVSSQNRHSCSGEPVLFNAHYTNQMHVLSQVMADVWHCLYGQDSASGPEVRDKLDSWHQQATQVILAATAMAEKPLLNESGIASVELGLRTLDFHYYFLLILLTITLREGRSDYVDPSQQMLRLLPSLGQMALDLKQPYTCLLWQSLHCPGIAFGTLWGQLVTNSKADTEQSKQSLEDIDHLPPFLGSMKSRTSVAAKLESITDRIVQHARLIFYSQDEVDPTSPTPSHSTQESPDSRASTRESLDQRLSPPAAPLHSAPSTVLPSTSSHENMETQLDGLFGLPDDCFLDATFDWFSWSSQELS